MSRRRPHATQRDRVLTALRRAGRRGLTQIDFHAPDVVDRGAPITRLSARIQELRDLGHRIDARREHDGLARYVLEAASTPSMQRRRPDVDALEISAPAPPPASAFDPFGDWA